MQLVVLIVLMGALYAFMIVPQQRRVKAQKALINSLQEGDVVVTSAGIHGAIAEVEDTVVWLEVAPEVELKISKASIAERISDDADDDEDDEDEDDEDDEDDDVMADADADADADDGSDADDGDA
jgi:preprotein translocase subunit YajC